MRAHTRVPTQPTMVQPRKKFSQKIARAFLFFRPTIAGMKYRRARTATQWKGLNIHMWRIRAAFYHGPGYVLAYSPIGRKQPP